MLKSFLRLTPHSPIAVGKGAGPSGNDFGRVATGPLSDLIPDFVSGLPTHALVGVINQGDMTSG